MVARQPDPASLAFHFPVFRLCDSRLHRFESFLSSLNQPKKLQSGLWALLGPSEDSFRPGFLVLAQSTLDWIVLLGGMSWEVLSVEQQFWSPSPACHQHNHKCLQTLTPPHIQLGATSLDYSSLTEIPRPRESGMRSRTGSDPPGALPASNSLISKMVPRPEEAPERRRQAALLKSLCLKGKLGGAPRPVPELSLNTQRPVRLAPEALP